MREQFEAWYLSHRQQPFTANELRCYDMKDKNKYFHPMTQLAWEAWQIGWIRGSYETHQLYPLEECTHE